MVMPTNPAVAEIPPAPQTLQATLEQSEALAIDDKQRKQFRIVTVYEWYLRELKILKAPRWQRPKRVGDRLTMAHQRNTPATFPVTRKSHENFGPVNL